MRAFEITLIGLVAAFVGLGLGCWAASVWTGDARWEQTAYIALAGAFVPLLTFILERITQS